MKIQKKILLFFIPPALLIYLIITGTVFLYARDLLTTLSSKLLITTVQSKADNISTLLIDQKQNVVDIAAASVFRDYLSNTADAVITEKVQKRLDRTIAGNPNIIELYILDPLGKILLSTDKDEIGEDKSNENVYRMGLKEVYVDDIIIYGNENTVTYAIAAPIKDDLNKFLGMLIIRFNTDTLSGILRNEVSYDDTTDLFLVNKDFYALTKPRYLGSDAVLTQKITTDNVVNCFDKDEVAYISSKNIHDRYIGEHIRHDDILQLKDYRGIDVAATHAYIPELRACLITKIDVSQLNKPILLISEILIGVSFGGILLFVVFGILFSKQISGPIEDLQKGIEIIKSGNLDYKVSVHTNDEIGSLSQSFNDMAFAIKQARADVDRKVEEQTREILQKSKQTEDQQKALVNVLEDVDMEKKKAEVLASDLMKFRLAVENASDHIVITDSDGIIVYANKAVETITGFSQIETLGKKAGGKDLWGGIMDKSFYEVLWKTIKEDKKVFAGEVNNHRKNGEKYIAIASISPILDNAGNVKFFIGIERDVTKLKEIDRMKTEFLSLASHQLRTPLSAMKWFGEMLLQGDAGTLTTEQKEMVENIYHSNERMIDLVNSLLNISRIESGRLIIDPKPTDIKTLVLDVLRDLELEFSKKHITHTFSADETLSQILIDPKLIRQVYINLLTNAIKYSPKGTSVAITLTKNQTELISEIKDNGFGIPKEGQKRIFEKFYRAQNILKKETEGTGLGLYLIKAILDSSGGRIWFESEENKGTTFWFTVPLSGMNAKKGDVSLSV